MVVWVVRVFWDLANLFASFFDEAIRFVSSVIDANVRIVSQQVQPTGVNGTGKRTKNTKVECNPFLAYSEWRLGFPLAMQTVQPNFAAAQKITLVLDLDETLVHSVPKQPFRGAPHHFDFKLEVDVHNTNNPTVYYVIKRPHVDFFLKTVGSWFDVVVFTASLRQYADPLIDILDPHRFISRRFFRDSCEMVTAKNVSNKPVTYFVKHLENVRKDLGRVLIVDNSHFAYANNKENAIPIKPFALSATQNEVDLADEELLNLLPFLHCLSKLEDVRSLLGLRTAYLGAASTATSPS